MKTVIWKKSVDSDAAKSLISIIFVIMQQKYTHVIVLIFLEN